MVTLSSNKNSFFILYFLANKHKIDGFDLVHGLLFELLISDPSFRGKKNPRDMDVRQQQLEKAVKIKMI